jgi:colicin import membrane protein
MSTDLVLSPKEFGIEEAKATVIEQSFLPKIVERDGLISVYENILTKEINKDVCNEAATLRKKLVKVRTGIADIHKTEKAFYLASGRYVDALKNKHTLPIEQMEEKLSEIEKYYENQEKERIASLQDYREALLAPYEVENVSTLDLGTMSETVWQAFLSGTETQFNQRKEAERITEEQRLAAIEAEKQRMEEQRIENERLKKEAEEIAKLRAEEQEKADAERKAAEEMLKAEREKAEAILAAERAEAARIAKIEADKQAAKLAEIESANKAAREKAAKELAEQQAIAAAAAAELKAKKDAEAKAEAERIAAEKKAAKAPDNDKLKAFVAAIQLPALPELSTSEANTILSELRSKFTSYITWANKQIESL